MLTIVELLAVPRLARLKEKRITAPHFGEKIETHHRTQPELRAVAERMRIHAHDPVGRVDAIVSAARTHVGVARKNSAMQHQHVVAEHHHVSVHGGGVGDPGRARALAIHRIGNVDRRLHFHFMFMFGVFVLRHGRAVCVMGHVLMRRMF